VPANRPLTWAVALAIIRSETTKPAIE